VQPWWGQPEGEEAEEPVALQGVGEAILLCLFEEEQVGWKVPLPWERIPPLRHPSRGIQRLIFGVDILRP
jgi:hypothetical protein